MFLCLLFWKRIFMFSFSSFIFPGLPCTLSCSQSLFLSSSALFLSYLSCAILHFHMPAHCFSHFLRCDLPLSCAFLCVLSLSILFTSPCTLPFLLLLPCFPLFSWFLLPSLPFSFMLLNSHSLSCFNALCLSVSFILLLLSNLLYLNILGKIQGFHQPESGQVLVTVTVWFSELLEMPLPEFRCKSLTVTEDRLITRHNTALWTFLIEFTGEILFLWGVPSLFLPPPPSLQSSHCLEAREYGEKGKKLI